MNAPDLPQNLLKALDVTAMLRTDPPDLEMLIPGLIPARKMGVFAAPAGFGKSYLALQWLMRLAARGHRVGLAEFEDDPDELHRRLVALRDGFNATELGRIEANLRIYVPNPTSGRLARLPDHLGELSETFAGCDLLVLDTLNRVASSSDENAAGPMGAVMLGADAVSRAINGAVLLLHHIGKGSNEISGKPLLQRLHQDTMRGSSAIGGAARFILTGAFLNEDDAEGAGLDPEEAQAGNLAGLCLSKCSSLPARKTHLYRRAPSGLLVPLEGSEEALNRLSHRAERSEAKEAGLPPRTLKTFRRIVEAGNEAAFSLDSPPDVRDKVTGTFWGKAADKSAGLRKLRMKLRNAGLIDDLGRLTPKGKSVANAEDVA